MQKKENSTKEIILGQLEKSWQQEIMAIAIAAKNESRVKQSKNTPTEVAILKHGKFENNEYFDEFEIFMALFQAALNKNSNHRFQLLIQEENKHWVALDIQVTNGVPSFILIDSLMSEDENYENPIKKFINLRFPTAKFYTFLTKTPLQKEGRGCSRFALNSVFTLQNADNIHQVLENVFKHSSADRTITIENMPESLVNLLRPYQDIAAIDNLPNDIKNKTVKSKQLNNTEDKTLNSLFKVNIESTNTNKKLNNFIYYKKKKYKENIEQFLKNKSDEEIATYLINSKGGNLISKLRNKNENTTENHSTTSIDLLLTNQLDYFINKFAYDNKLPNKKFVESIFESNENFFINFLMIIILNNKTLIKIDKKQYYELIKLLAEKGVPKAQFQLGNFLSGQGEYQKGIEWLIKAGNNGYKRAQFGLIKYYVKEKNTKEVLRWYKEWTQNINKTVFFKSFIKLLKNIQSNFRASFLMLLAKNGQLKLNKNEFNEVSTILPKADSKENQIIHFLAISNSHENIADHLKVFPYINVTNKAENTPLHLAVKNNATETVNQLLFYGADINIKNAKNKTPLDLAENNQSIQTILKNHQALLKTQQQCENFIKKELPKFSIFSSQKLLWNKKNYREALHLKSIVKARNNLEKELKTANEREYDAINQKIIMLNALSKFLIGLITFDDVNKIAEIYPLYKKKRGRNIIKSRMSHTEKLYHNIEKLNKLRKGERKSVFGVSNPLSKLLLMKNLLQVETETTEKTTNRKLRPLNYQL